MNNNTVYLVFGLPGAGKSWLANRLSQERSCVGVSLDHLYVQFIREQCEGLYFPYLNHYISIHYDSLIHPLALRCFSQRNYGRDFFAEWQTYVVSALCSRLEGILHPLVAEGYALKVALPYIEHALNEIADVYPIEVKRFVADDLAQRSQRHEYYYRGQRISYEDVCALAYDGTKV